MVIIHETLIIWINGLRTLCVGQTKKIKIPIGHLANSGDLICPCIYNSVKLYKLQWQWNYKCTWNDMTSLNLRSSDLCIPVHVIHAHPQSSMLTSMYLYTWNHVDIQMHDTLAYTSWYSYSFSCLNYFCTELLSDCDIIFILVPKNILHTCFYAANISNEWTQWWINFLDCVTFAWVRWVYMCL